MSRKTLWRGNVSGLLLLALVTTSLPLPREAEAVVVEQSQLPAPVIVQETSSELTARGCLARGFKAAQPIDVPPGMPYPVFGSDFSPGTSYFCSPEVRQSLTVVQGEVKPGPLIVIPAILAGAGIIYGGKRIVSNAVNSALGEIAERILKGLIVIMTVFAEVIAWLLGLSISFLEFAITAPSGFIRNPIVARTWPFVQGIANLGFMIALLFIAFATTLQLKQDFTAKKMLPRLLIAALLINFSLVIAGVLIDLTQVTMAVLYRALTQSPFGAMGDHLLAGTGALEIAEEVVGYRESVEAETGSALIDIAVAAIMRLFVGLVLVIALLTLGVVLLVRYIVLLVLLILSPLPYVAIAFPNGKSVANKWWGEFVKYALFGPIALFFIILAIEVSSLIEKAEIDSGGRGIDNIIQALLVAIIAVSSILVTRKLAGSFSLGTVDFAGGKAKQAGRALGRGARKAAGAATKPARQSARDFTQRAGAGLKDYAKGKGVPLPAQRDKDGKLKPGQSSLGSRAGDAVKRRLSPKVQQKIATGKSIEQQVTGAGNNPALWNRNVVNSMNLRDGETTKAAGKPTINMIVEQTDDREDINQVVNNRDHVRSLNDTERLALQQAIRDNGNAGLSDTDKARIITSLMKEIKKIDGE